jgi:hypothetical protein
MGYGTPFSSAQKAPLEFLAVANEVPTTPGKRRQNGLREALNRAVNESTPKP